MLMKVNRYLIKAIQLLFMLTAVSMVRAEDIEKKSVFDVMTNYEKLFGTYILVTGNMAEMVDDEFILEADASEEKILATSYNPKKLELKDLFINIRIEERPIRAEIAKVSQGTKLLLLLEVRESAVYNKIIPVFVVHDFQSLGKGEQIQSFEAKQQGGTNSAQADSKVRFGKKIKLKRR